MATVEEAATAFAQDMVNQNMAGLMQVFTPEGMMKAMALQGRLQARAAQAMAAGHAPAPMSGFTVDAKGADGEDQVVHLNLESNDGTAEVLTKWRELEGVWKVTDLALVEARDGEGNIVDLSAPLPASGSESGTLG